MSSETSRIDLCTGAFLSWKKITSPKSMPERAHDEARQQEVARGHAEERLRVDLRGDDERILASAVVPSTRDCALRECGDTEKRCDE